MGSEEETNEVDEQKALVSLLKDPPAAKEDEKITRNCEGVDSALARVEVEKRLALIKAWEDNEKTKVDNKINNHHLCSPNYTLKLETRIGEACTCKLS